MKILIVVDIPEWAIGKLSVAIMKKNPHLSFRMLAIHPKDLRRDDRWQSVFANACEEYKPDIVHFQYFDTAHTLAPLWGGKKILTHHNQKNLLTHDFRGFDAVVVHTQKAKKILEANGYGNVQVIQHGIDLERFPFNENYDAGNRLLGYTGRIVPWKHPEMVLEAARHFETEAVMMGRIDKADVWRRCLSYEEQMDLRFGVPDKDQSDAYHDMGVYIGASEDGIEEGPLGLLEAMACGVPVITTPAGEAADIIKDRENGLFFDFNSQDSLHAALRRFFAMTQEEKDKMREKAWDTVRHLNEDRMGRLYEKLYWKTAYGRDLVSVIIPTYNRAEILEKVLEAYSLQTYRPIELIVIDDCSQDGAATTAVLSKYRSQDGFLPIKALRTTNQGYGLAEARNRGIFEASGNYLVFNDDRMVPEPEAVEKLIRRLSSLKQKAAVWGNKGKNSDRSFIENFFAIRKRHIAEAGMFNERVDRYGGQSQEFRERLLRQGFILQFEPEAKAVPAVRTRRNKRRYDILASKIQLWKLDN